jgi:adenylate cyclase
VVRLLAIYSVAAWLVLQVVDVTFPMMGMPPWADRLVLVLLAVGLIVGLVLSWTFDMTPAGIVRTSVADGSGGGGDAPGSVVGGSVVDSEDPAAVPSDADGASPIPKREFSALAIAVLPFANLSQDPENEYFSDGITEDILTNLSRIEDLHVVSRTSVMVYKGTTKQIPEIARELEVGTVLEGSVRRAGVRVRVSAQLIDARTDKHLWAETYDRDLEDIFEVQSAISETIARALEARLTPEVVERIRRHPTDNVAAYDHFLRGREAFRQADAERTIVELEKAVALDPNFAAAFGALAGSYVLSMYWGGASSTDVLPKATEATKRAIELDEEHALCWMARGLLDYHFEYDFKGAVLAFDRAVALDPDDADIRLWRGHCLAQQRRFDEAIESFRRGVEIDPHHVYDRAWIGFTLAMKGKDDDRAEAERVLRESIARDPDHHEAQGFLGWTLLGWGRFAEAAEQFSICYGIVPSPFYELLRVMALREIDPDLDVALALTELRGPLEGEENHAALAVLALVAGDVDEAMDALEEGVKRRAPIIPWFWSIPALTMRLEGHPRYVALGDRVLGADG